MFTFLSRTDSATELHSALCRFWVYAILTAVPGSILPPRRVATVGHFRSPPQAGQCGRDFWQGQEIRHCYSARRSDSFPGDKAAGA